MIVLTRLNGSRFAINDEQIERLEEAPNTIVVLVTGNRYAVLESLDEIVEAIVEFRGKILGVAEGLGIPSQEHGIDRRHTALSLLHARSGPRPDNGPVEVRESNADITPINSTDNHDEKGD